MGACGHWGRDRRCPVEAQRGLCDPFMQTECTSQTRSRKRSFSKAANEHRLSTCGYFCISRCDSLPMEALDGTLHLKRANPAAFTVCVHKMTPPPPIDVCLHLPNNKGFFSRYLWGSRRAISCIYHPSFLPLGLASCNLTTPYWLSLEAPALVSTEKSPLQSVGPRGVKSTAAP